MLVIAQKISGSVLWGAGLAIAATMLVLTLSGVLGLLVKCIPLCVVRSIQFGGGLSLASLALGKYVPSTGWPDYALAGGGLAGHYAFGARTGDSVIIYVAFYLALGLFLSGPLQEVLKLFPLPILGVVLLFEALALLRLLRDQSSCARHTAIALLVGVLALTVPQGFVVGLVIGTLL